MFKNFCRYLPLEGDPSLLGTFSPPVFVGELKPCGCCCLFWPAASVGPLNASIMVVCLFSLCNSITLVKVDAPFCCLFYLSALWMLVHIGILPLKNFYKTGWLTHYSYKEKTPDGPVSFPLLCFEWSIRVEGSFYPISFNQHSWIHQTKNNGVLCYVKRLAALRFCSIREVRCYNKISRSGRERMVGASMLHKNTAQICRINLNNMKHKSLALQTLQQKQHGLDGILTIAVNTDRNTSEEVTFTTIVCRSIELDI